MDELVDRSKRYKERFKLVDRAKRYTLEEAINAIKQIQASKGGETLSLNMQLGVKTSSGTENVRGAISLPHGSGKTVKLVCFCKGEAAKEAKDAGADFVGGEELVQKVQKENWFDFDAVVAHPDMMREVSKLGRVLGPKGLMPTPKTGTVTPQVGRAVKELKAGRIEFKSDKTGGLHAIFGKLSFEEKALVENAKVVVKAIQDAKPQTVKGEYIKTASIAPSHGPGFRLAVKAL